jgi:protein-disulfide isomerase
LDTKKFAAEVDRDIAEASHNQLEGTPVFSVNGTRLSGAHDLRTFRELIEVEVAWLSSRADP